jgi:hypothetical protein
VPADLLERLAVDAAAIAALAYGVYYRRHRRQDLFVIFTMFNVGLVLALVVITAGNVSAGVGFGLFAVLSIVRLRSEPFTNAELAYFFLALVIGLVNGIDIGDPLLAAALSALAVAAAAVIDHPRLLRRTHALEVTLETIPPGEEALRRHLEERLNTRVTECRVLEIDYVRETVRVAVRCVSTPLTPPAPEAALHAPLARHAA